MSTANQTVPRSIVIVGAGFSGTLVAAQLLRQARSPLIITLVERDPARFNRGVAYGTHQRCHLLNVPAGKMSAYPDDPDNFLRWAQLHQSQLLNPPWVTRIDAGTFIPRRFYGDYLHDVLNEAEALAQPDVRLYRLVDKALRLQEKANGIQVSLESGLQVQADRVVFAAGNFPPGNPRLADPGFYDSPRYHGNPWATAVISDLLHTKACLLVGSGLTMVDWVMALRDANYGGTIHVVSRRGLWPQAHTAVLPWEGELKLGNTPSVLALLQVVRRAIRDSGADWRVVIDSLRPRVPEIWQGFSVKDRRRFLRHLRPYWDCHRHRLAPVIAQRLQLEQDAGRLYRHVGRVLAYQEGQGGTVKVTLQRRGQSDLENFHVNAVLNCSGSESDYRNLESPFVHTLLDDGLIRPDALSLGLDATSEGAVINHQGQPSAWFYTLGPPLKGILWETTAVPEIRVQAGELAKTLVLGFG